MGSTTVYNRPIQTYNELRGSMEPQITKTSASLTLKADKSSQKLSETKALNKSHWGYPGPPQQRDSQQAAR